MADYRHQLHISRIGPRPPFGEVVAHVFGAGANVDTDGDSATPSATDWTWLYMRQRPSEGSPVVLVQFTDDRLDRMIISSDDEALARKTAACLSR